MFERHLLEWRLFNVVVVQTNDVEQSHLNKVQFCLNDIRQTLFEQTTYAQRTKPLVRELNRVSLLRRHRPKDLNLAAFKEEESRPIVNKSPQPATQGSGATSWFFVYPYFEIRLE